MSLVGRFEHLPNRPKSDEARPLLEKIASQVKPIMSKRGWKVGTLAEFLPSNPALLGNNMNAGQRINLRLRPPGDITSFYEYDQLVLVMLHELTHIEHGPHDASFYKLLAVLEEEYYDLKRKGYSGEGFHGEGNHLSGFKVPEHVGKAKGLAAAQKRLEVQKKIGKGGVLGGSDYKNRSMKEVLAEAAERRMRDDKACQSQNAGHAKEVEEEVRRAQEESVGIDAEDIVHEPSHGDVTSAEAGIEKGKHDEAGPGAEERELSPEIQIIDPPPDRMAIASAPRSTSASRQSSSSRKSKEAAPPATALRRTKPTPAAAVERVVRRPSPTPATGADEWSCPTCTLINPSSSLSCDACATSRPVQLVTTSEGWFCEFCGSGPREMGFWSCVNCGWVRKWG